MGRVYVAVRVASVVPGLTVCERAPPSDQLLNAAVVAPDPVVGAAVTLTGDFWMKVSVYGATWSVSPTVTVAPVGALENVRSTDFGSSRTVLLSLRPPLSVTVAVRSRCEGYSCGGAVKLPDAPT